VRKWPTAPRRRGTGLRPAGSVRSRAYQPDHLVFMILGKRERTPTMREWPGLSHDDLREIGSRIETACGIAIDRAMDNHPDDAKAATAQFLDMREGIRLAVADELTRLGCPPASVGDWITTIIMEQRAYRAAEVRAAAGHGGSAALH
jgi:hypothetical protein